LIPQDDERPQGVRDIVLQLRREGNNLECINKCHPAYLPLHYVLLFPYGELRWHVGLQHSYDQGNLTQKGYFVFWLVSGHQNSPPLFMVENFSNNSLLMRGLQHNKID
jgi:hypothetical protein